MLVMQILDTKKIGEEYLVDITITGGIIGRDALINKFIEVYICFCWLIVIFFFIEVVTEKYGFYFY